MQATLQTRYNPKVAKMSLSSPATTPNEPLKHRYKPEVVKMSHFQPRYNPRSPQIGPNSILKRNPPPPHKEILALRRTWKYYPFRVRSRNVVPAISTKNLLHFPFCRKQASLWQLITASACHRPISAFKCLRIVVTVSAASRGHVSKNSIPTCSSKALLGNCSAPNGTAVIYKAATFSGCMASRSVVPFPPTR